IRSRPQRQYPPLPLGEVAPKARVRGYAPSLEQRPLPPIASDDAIRPLPPGGRGDNPPPPPLAGPPRFTRGPPPTPTPGAPRRGVATPAAGAGAGATTTASAAGRPTHPLAPPRVLQSPTACAGPAPSIAAAATAASAAADSHPDLPDMKISPVVSCGP